MSVLEIGCCGANCRTCPEFKGNCKGCKIGYEDGTRHINKAKCKIKVCCIKKGHDTCADCSEYADCAVIQDFYKKKGYKYQKYREAISFIIANGYDEFLAVSSSWKRQYGKYKK